MKVCSQNGPRCSRNEDSLQIVNFARGFIANSIETFNEVKSLLLYIFSSILSEWRSGSKVK